MNFNKEINWKLDKVALLWFILAIGVFLFEHTSAATLLPIISVAALVGFAAMVWLDATKTLDPSHRTQRYFGFIFFVIMLWFAYSMNTACDTSNGHWGIHSTTNMNPFATENCTGLNWSEFGSDFTLHLF